MGGKGPRTRSGESVPSQSWCCVPNESRTRRESRRLVYAARQVILGNARASRAVRGASPRTFATVIRRCSGKSKGLLHGPWIDVHHSLDILARRGSLHWSRRHDFRALLRNRPALADAPIDRVDVDDHRLFKTRYVVSGDCANVRWRASVFSLSHCQQGENRRKEIRPTAAHAETRSHLHKTCDHTRLAVHLFRLSE